MKWPPRVGEMHTRGLGELKAYIAGLWVYVRLCSCPKQVSRVILVVGRLLPVFPWKWTSSGPIAMSQRCQTRKCLMSRMTQTAFLEIVVVLKSFGMIIAIPNR
jgi:hypothetical protein